MSTGALLLIDFYCFKVFNIAKIHSRMGAENVQYLQGGSKVVRGGAALHREAPGLWGYLRP